MKPILSGARERAVSAASSLGRTVVGLLVIVASASPAVGVSTEAAIETLQLASCEIETAELAGRCGVLSVPADRVAGRRERLELKVVILPARSGEALPDPIVYLTGGPGAAATDSASFFGDSLTRMQQRRQVVLMDYRGTGRESPLRCGLGPTEKLALIAGPRPVAGLRACRERLTVDPSHFATTDVVADLEALRRELGAPQFNLLAASYGTRVALAYMREYPDRVRTATLRGVVPPSANAPAEVFGASRAATVRLVAACAADAACGAAFPNLATELHELRRRIASEPERIEAEAGEVTLGEPELAGIIRFAMYSDRSSRFLPWFVHRSAEGDRRALARMLGSALQAVDRLSAASMFSVICSEDVPFLDAASRDLMGAEAAARLEQVCRAWPVTPVPSSFKRPVVSAVPTLLLSGAEDPASPPSLAHEAAKDLSNSLDVVVPGLAHHPTWTSCFSSLTAELIERGSVADLDVACADSYDRAPFVTRDPLTLLKWASLGAGLLVAWAVIWLIRRRIPKAQVPT